MTILLILQGRPQGWVIASDSVLKTPLPKLISMTDWKEAISKEVHNGLT